MMREIFIVAIASGLCAAFLALPASAGDRVTMSEKGSLVVYPKVEVRWDSQGNVVQDTFIDITNDYPEDVSVQMFFVNGDGELDECGGAESHYACTTLPEDATVDKVDVFLLFDDTGSFWTYVDDTKDVFNQIVADLQIAMPGVDFAFGVGRFEDYGGPGWDFGGFWELERPFILNQAILRAVTPGFAAAIATALGNEAPGGGGDGPESAIAEGLWQVATGLGFDGNGNGSNTDSGLAGAIGTQTAPGTSGDVPSFDTHVGVTDGTLGGVGFREGALHLVILATDICPIAPFDYAEGIPATISGTGGEEPVSVFACSSIDPGGNRFGYVSDAYSAGGNTIPGAVAPVGAATVPATVTALNDLGIRVIGLAPGGAPTDSPGPDWYPSVFLSALARLTGAVDALGDPLVFDITGGADPIAAAIVEAVGTTVTLPIDLTLTADPALPGVSVAINPDVVPNVAPGETACFDVTFTMEGWFPGGSVDLNFRDAASNAILDTQPIMLGPSVCRMHLGCNWVDNMIELTANEPTFWSALSGMPKGTSPFTILDPGFPPGRPDPDGSSDRVLRGFVLAWAVDATGVEIRHNHLKGDALLVNYRNGSAWEYNAYAFSANAGTQGMPTGTPGELYLDGSEYDYCFESLLLDFYAAGSTPFGTAFFGGGVAGGAPPITVFTDLTLLPMLMDLTQDGDGLVTTKAKFDIWNMNEWKFSGTERCISCWDQKFLGLYDPPNHFLRRNLQTDKGKARIIGLRSTVCPDSVDTPLLGVAMKMLRFGPQQQVGQAGMHLFGMGEDRSAVITADLIGGPPPERSGEDTAIGIKRVNTRR